MRTELSTEPLSHEPNRIARSPAPPGAGVVPWTLPPALPPTAEWQRYLAAALRFKWVVLGVTLACTALGVLGALLVKPSYVARATVWVQVPLRPARDEGPIWSGQLPISRSEEHTSELQSHSDLVCRLLLEKKNKNNTTQPKLLGLTS